MAVGNDFPSIFSSAMAPPEVPGVGEFVSAFRASGSTPYGTVGPDEPGKIAGTTKYDFVIKRRVFLIYRPWESCQRCLDDVANNSVALPSSGDHECPHNELPSYEDVVTKILAGAYLFGSESEIANKDGTVAVSLRWYEPKPRGTARADP